MELRGQVEAVKGLEGWAGPVHGGQELCAKEFVVSLVSRAGSILS